MKPDDTDLIKTKEGDYLLFQQLRDTINSCYTACASVKTDMLECAAYDPFAALNTIMQSLDFLNRVLTLKIQYIKTGKRGPTVNESYSDPDMKMS